MIHTGQEMPTVASPREKIVIIQTSGGGRQVLSRARLLVSGDGKIGPIDSDLTEVGREILGQAANVDGITIAVVYRHGFLFRLVHPELWSWEEVEKGVIAAFSAVLGAELDVIREGQT